MTTFIIPSTELAHISDSENSEHTNKCTPILNSNTKINDDPGLGKTACGVEISNNIIVIMAAMI